MDYISSKNIFYIIRDTLRLIDGRVMEHGSRVAYIIYKMQQCKGGYEDYEMADMAMLTTIHDIGVYKTDDPGDMLRYEGRDYMPHSIYGYLFLKYLSPLEKLSKVLLYHHTDYNQLVKLADNEQIRDLASYINIAEKMDIYHNAMGSKFDYKMFQKYSGTKLSKEGLELFYQAVEECNVLENIKNGSYKEELEQLFDNLIFTNEEKRDYIQMLMHCIAFISETYAVCSRSCAYVSRELAKKFMATEEELEVLHYASLLRDIGMLTLPKDMINAHRRIDEEEMKVLRTHVDKTEELLRGRIKDEIVDLAISHHERGDGTGYPKHITDAQSNKLQRILQVADKVSALSLDWNFRPAKTKQELIDQINSKAERNKLNPQVTAVMINNYDAIMNRAKEKMNDALAMYKKLNEDYEKIRVQFERK